MREVGKAESISNEEKKEMSDFIAALGATSVFQVCVCVCVCVSAAGKACQQPVKQKKEMSDLSDEVALWATSVFQVCLCVCVSS